jgi:hypothetical protein
MAVKKRKAPAWSWMVVLLVFGLLGTLYFHWDRERLTPERMESLVATELRPGMGRQEVGRWIAAVALKGRYRGAVQVSGRANLPSIVVQFAKASAIDLQALASVVVLSVPAARMHLRYSEDMFVYFFFDGDDRLLKHHIELRPNRG